MSWTNSAKRGENIIRCVTALMIGGLYLWCVHAAGQKFIWGYKLVEYYDRLAQGLTSGHLYLPLEPSPALLALQDPWDPVQNQSLREHDLALYQNHYYMYQGVTPAIILFVPWRLITGTDVTERFAVFVFCFLGYLFSCALLIRILKWLDVRPPLAIFALLVLALGICQAVPYLLVRVNMYEVPIACGYMCLSAGFYALIRALEPSRRSALWMAGCGLLLSAGIGCRPHLGTAVVIVWLALLVRGIRAGSGVGAFFSRDLIAFTIPAVACIIALGAYNYGRFQNPMEFGLRYMIAGASYTKVRLEGHNILPGCYYLLLCPPELDSVFPYLRLSRQVLQGLPKRYFLEPIAGAFTTWPVALAAVVAPLLWGRTHLLLWALYLVPLSSIVAMSATGLVSHRYTVDFLPELVLLASVVMAVLIARSRGLTRLGVMTVSVALVLYSMAVNLALGIQGPYDEVVQVSPAKYVKLARCFSPVPELRPLLNPRFVVEATFDFTGLENTGAKPLVTAGRLGSRYALYAEAMSGGVVRLVSSTSLTAHNSVFAEVMLAPGKPDRVRVEYSPHDLVMLVFWNDQKVLQHRLPFLITAPAQVEVGEDWTGVDDPPDPFRGSIKVLKRLVTPSK